MNRNNCIGLNDRNRVFTCYTGTYCVLWTDTDHKNYTHLWTSRWIMIHHEENIDVWYFIIHRNRSINRQEGLDTSRSCNLDYDGKFYDDDQKIIRILQVLQHLFEWLVCLWLDYRFCDIAGSLTVDTDLRKGSELRITPKVILEANYGARFLFRLDSRRGGVVPSIYKQLSLRVPVKQEDLLLSRIFLIRIDG